MDDYRLTHTGPEVDEAVGKALNNEAYTAAEKEKLAATEIFTSEEKAKVDASEIYSAGDAANVAKLDGKSIVNVLDESPDKIPTNKAVSEALANPTGLDNLAYVEGGTTATKAYAAGEYLVYNGKLYRTKTAIANGAAFVADTNIERTNVGEALENVAIYSDTAPVNGTTGAPKNGIIYAHVKGAANVDYYACIDAANKVWANIASIEPTVVSDVITTSGTWTAPESVGQSFRVIAVGGGGGGGGGGGSGASLQIATATIPKNQSVNVTIGAGGNTGENGGTTSFGTYVTAYGGYAAETNAGGSARSADGMGGGGGGYGCAGGNGGYYGGGGGGGGKRSNGTAGAGGNGGYYGGGGGGAGTTDSGATTGGAGGAYGGNGGNGGTSTYDVAQSGSNGTNTIGMGLDFEGTGAGGTASTGSVRYQGGGGGGGYGGNGGNGGTYYSNNSGSGGGGGGYGGNGGNGSNGSNGGGGGGGYGGNGGNGSNGSYGGGYGVSNYGAGGYAGVVIVQRTIPAMVWKGVTA